MLLRLFLAK